MTNPYYNPTGYPATRQKGPTSAPMRAELTAVAAGFALLPTLSGNGGKLLVVNQGGTAQTVASKLSENANGGIVLAAPSSGDALTLGAASGGRMILAEASLSGQSAIIKLSNSSNTPSSDAVMLISSAGGSAGDAYLRLDVAGTTTYVLGIDNSDSDKLVLSRTQVVGTTNVLEITTAGNVTFKPPGSGVAVSITAVAGQNGLVVSDGPVRTQSTTVGGLLAAATAGDGARAFVTDATARTFDAVPIGGGFEKVPVWCDGAQWRIG